MATESRLNPVPWQVMRVDYPKGLDASFEIHDANGKVVAQTFMREIKKEPEYFAADEANCCRTRTLWQR